MQTSAAQRASCPPSHLTRGRQVKEFAEIAEAWQGGENKIEAEDQKKKKKALDAQELQTCCEVTGKYNLIIRYTGVMAFARLERDFPVIEGLQGSLALSSHPQMRAQLHFSAFPAFRGV